MLLSAQVESQGLPYAGKCGFKPPGVPNPPPSPHLVSHVSLFPPCFYLFLTVFINFEPFWPIWRQMYLFWTVWTRFKQFWPVSSGDFFSQVYTHFFVICHPFSPVSPVFTNFSSSVSTHFHLGSPIFTHFYPFQRFCTNFSQLFFIFLFACFSSFSPIFPIFTHCHLFTPVFTNFYPILPLKHPLSPVSTVCNVFSSYFLF